MKNIKMSVKLIVSFLVVVLLTTTVGIVGILGMVNISSSGVNIYENQTVPAPYLGRAEETLQRMRVYVREMVMASMAGDMDGVEKAFATIGGLIPVMERNLDAYRAAVKDEEARSLFDQARTLYEVDLTRTVMSIYAAAQKGDIPTISNLLITCREVSNKILSNFERCMSIMVHDAKAAAYDAKNLSNTLLTTIICVLVIAISIAMFLAFYISGLISKPLARVVEVLKKGEDGDMRARSKIDQKDEIGIVSKAVDGFFDEMLKVVENIRANSDTLAGASEELSVVSRQLTNGAEETVTQSATVAGSAEQMSVNINAMASGAEEASVNANEVAGAADQMSSNMNTIAAAVEEMTASISQIASSASEANKVADSATVKAKDATATMSKLGVAAKEIGQVTDVIKKIADKTNLLALN
ncbi:MAG: methyl-accepting chemotaxis protein, partial [Fibromonadaceae bacterium]|nr:methyl-accepting chemotaxis protein [Fibromonadaceae bacterium]